jgi:hypothetical protein
MNLGLRNNVVYRNQSHFAPTACILPIRRPMEPAVMVVAEQ